MIKIRIFDTPDFRDWVYNPGSTIIINQLLNYDKDYGSKFIFTEKDDYTHAFVLNKAMPKNLLVPKEKVIGISCEPTVFLNINQEYIDYVVKNVGVYYLCNKGKLPDPFVEKYIPIIFTIPKAITLKKNIMSLMVSRKHYAPGHNYRHRLARVILDNGLPINIHGNGCHEYSREGDNRIKGSFKDNELYDDYMFTIAIENYRDGDYHSEKVINPLLRSTMPIYYGCKTIKEKLGDVIELTGNLEEDMGVIISVLKDPYKYYSVKRPEHYLERVSIKKLINTLV